MGRQAEVLIPAEALPAWQDLVAALFVHGPSPCEESERPDSWHADKGRPQVREALAECRRCGAAPECLSYALAADERYGVWGGQTAEERAARGRQAVA